ncbi:hypothetical protein IX307_000598 [Bacteroides pyogenes]|uniref:O-antigen polymerase n=1 Tax=Bacteroides pyogenes TaxID=310300 RepID=UPI001BAA0089|nr:O-antigen polymerase [Bacteroides pyogenes]MBR8719420.1 hypothetical protein [Bacteroides pyogenes]MBR8786295.1 hypothetical protein [Bacteroides pyogenes]MBR8791778.1 hypothetical protein [Bacteroides pyogenes]MCF2708804.1 oligosaccharide repeat unit polymerase [Bacteroides pyogenes]
MREGSIYAILYAIVWSVFFLSLWKKYGPKSASVFVTVFYVLYSILAIFLYNHVDYALDFNTLTIFPYVYLFIMILLSLKPIMSFDKSNVLGLVAPKPSLIAAFTYVFILLALVSLPSTIIEMRSGITLLLLDSSAGADLYADAHGGGVNVKTLADVPKYLFSIFSYISILIFYYYLTKPRLKKFVLFGLSICMLYNLLRPISLGLRTDTVMAIYAILAGYVIMRRWIPKERRKNILMAGSSVGAMVIGLMLILSISRFTNSVGGVGGTNLDYIAQSSLNFNNYGLDAGGIRYGDRTCRIFKEVLGFENVPSGIVGRRAKYQNMKMNDSIFYTFVGDFTLDFGPIVAFIIFLLYSLWFTKLSRVNDGVITFSRLLVVYLEILIPLQGGMYLFTFSDGGNYSLMAFAFTALLFSQVNRNSPNTIIWSSNN